MTARVIAGVVVGAVTGAVLRWTLGELVGARSGLLLANTIGCVVIGWAAVHARDRAWLITGWCGTLTSFSALALQIAVDLDGGDLQLAFGWTGATTLVCAIGFFGGGLLPARMASA